jgi:uncharacterized membrane protein
MKWFSAIASFGVMAALTVSSSGCKKADQQTSPGNKFSVKAPGDINISPGKTEKVTIKIDRKKGFEDGTVKFKLTGFPTGVTADPADPEITGKNDAVDVKLTASKEAKEEAKEVTITGDAGGDKAEARFKVNVKK